MTITKGQKIMVAADPTDIYGQFQNDSQITKSIEIYKNYCFVEYYLIDASENSPKNTTFDKMELRTTKNGINANPQSQDNVLTFRIAKEELNKLNELLQTSFQSSNKLTLKATKIPTFLKNKLGDNYYSNAYLTIFDNSANSTKSGILFKPLKKPYEINDFEEQYEEEQENQILGQLLFSSVIRTKVFKKFSLVANKSKNKMLNMYVYKEKDNKENNLKIYFYLTHFSNYINIGKYLEQEDNNEEFKYIHKIQIKSDTLIKILRNFNNDVNNPDYISVWSKGIIFKTNFILKSNFDALENNEGNNLFENDAQENNEEETCYMILKALAFFEKNDEKIYFEGINIDDGNEKNKFMKKIIKNNVDDNHDELNKSLELNDIEDAEVYRANNSFMDDEDEEDDNINNDNDKIDNNKNDKNNINHENDKSDNNNNKSLNINSEDDDEEEEKEEKKEKESNNKRKRKNKKEKSPILKENDSNDLNEINDEESQESFKNKKKIKEPKGKKAKKKK